MRVPEAKEHHGQDTYYARNTRPPWPEKNSIGCGGGSIFDSQEPVLGDLVVVRQAAVGRVAARDGVAAQALIGTSERKNMGARGGLGIISLCFLSITTSLRLPTATDKCRARLHHHFFRRLDRKIKVFK